jgi:hypothetical protein
MQGHILKKLENGNAKKHSNDQGYASGIKNNLPLRQKE